MDAQVTAETRQKLQRVTQACDFCHRRGLRCVQPPPKPAADGSSGPSECLTCVKYGQQCTRNRKPKKRGTKPRPKPAEGLEECVSCKTASPLSAEHGRSPTTLSVVDGAHDESAGPRRQTHCSHVPSQVSSYDSSGFFPSSETVNILINIYLDSIYPLYPFFCETELLLWWRNERPAPDASFYSSVMCMCALSALQAERGALFSTDLGFVPSRSLSESLLREALQLTSTVYRAGEEVSLLRCYGILAFIGTQMGDPELLHRYLGLYQGLAAQVGFYNEERWPPGLTVCQRECRQRVFWTVYRLEVHNASVLGHPIRIPESQTFVQYPCGVHHVLIFPERNGMFENWIAGWNYATDLYRILEHAIVDFRSRRTAHSTVLWSESRPKPPAILQQLKEMQSGLMPEFAQAAMKSTDSGSNRCGFQVANILSTIHLVKMVVMASEDAGFNEVCQTVIDLVESLGTVPKDYKRAFGAPLIQELLGVGFMLTSISGRLQSLTDAEHLQMRQIILFLVAFIDGLGDCIESAQNAAACLRSSLARVDQEFSQRVGGDGLIPLQNGPTSANSGGASHCLGMVNFGSTDMPWIPSTTTDL